MENQYIERGIYKVRQDGTKEFVAFKTREEKLADIEKKKELIMQQMKIVVLDRNTTEIYFNTTISARCRTTIQDLLRRDLLRQSFGG